MRTNVLPDPLYSAVRVVRASKILRATDKLVWAELHTFDSASRKKGERGAYISASGLAERLGMTKDEVEHVRRKLVALELLGTSGHGKAARYWPLLPPAAIASRRPQSDELQRCAAALDAHVAALPNGATIRAIREAAPQPPASQPRRALAACRQEGMALIKEALDVAMAHFEGPNGANPALAYKEVEVGIQDGAMMEGVLTPSSVLSVSEDSIPSFQDGDDIACAIQDGGAKTNSAFQRSADERLVDYRQRYVKATDPRDRRLLQASIARLEAQAGLVACAAVEVAAVGAV